MPDQKGYCTTCQKDVDSLHKCPHCHKYVMVPQFASKVANKQVRQSVSSIRKKYAPEFRALEIDPDDTMDKAAEKRRDAEMLTAKMNAEIDAYKRSGA